MIYDFALEPELVATWHDRRAAYPVLCQMGIGHRRVPCAYPAASWKGLVLKALREGIAVEDSPEWQKAKKNIEVLLEHLLRVGTKRNGRLQPGEDWLAAALREHGQFPFGGILVRSSGAGHAHIVAVDRLAEEESATWTPPTPPVIRTSRDLARALAPLLRSAAQLRFVDPYFDPAVPSFLEPMREYLLAAQSRRTIGDLRFQIHTSVRADEVAQRSRLRGRPITEREVVDEKLDACARTLGPILQPGVTVRAFVWGQGRGGIRLHNRYVLAEVGGVAVQTGLDSGPTGQTDDLTLLAKEQFEVRWREFDATGAVYPLVAERTFPGPQP